MTKRQWTAGDGERGRTKMTHLSETQALVEGHDLWLCKEADDGNALLQEIVDQALH